MRAWRLKRMNARSWNDYVGMSVDTAVSEKRLSLTANGQVRYQLKTPYRDGTTHVIFEPLDQIAGSDFEQPKVGPKGGGQDARSNSCNAWPPSSPAPGSI